MRDISPDKVAMWGLLLPLMVFVILILPLSKSSSVIEDDGIGNNNGDDIKNPPLPSHTSRAKVGICVCTDHVANEQHKQQHPPLSAAHNRERESSIP